MAVQTGSRPDSLFGRALREGIMAGLLALGLFCLIIGFKTDQNINNELVLEQRWGTLAIMVAIAAVGRFLFIAFLQPWLEARKLAKSSRPAVSTENPSFVRRNFSRLGVAFLFVYPVLIVAALGWQGSLKWVDNFGVQILIYVMLAWGLNIVVGLAGLLDLGYVAFYAVGAYSYAILSSYFGLAFSAAHYKFFLYYVILLLALLTAWVTIRLRRMPVGRAWEALREDEIACRSLGINTTTTKLTAFATGAMFGGFAGSFFAARQGFVSPESFVFLESAVILAIVVLGGMGSLVGIAIAAIVMIGGTEILREMSFLKIIFGPDFTPELYRMLIFGLAMVVVMVWKPRGFVGSREPSAFLNARKMVSGAFTKEGHG
ncbi:MULTISPECIES: ABC transporter permease subunit [unclassified Brucella]|uniref:ABC transporter permease subunit n=1 Tax=Brucella amazoniensis TaxID=2837955 RepID=UPI00384EB666